MTSIPTLLWKIIDFVVWFVCTCLDVVVDVSAFWKNKTLDYLFTPDEKTILEASLQQCKSYMEWERLAFRLDAILGNDIWRQNAASTKYDYRLISNRLIMLTKAREDGDIDTLVSRLRSGLLRNLASISSINLYNRAYSGTKYLIEDYINEVIECLDYVNSTEPTEDITKLWLKKTDFFHDILQSYGRTALVLHGGSLFGFCHLGTVKALLDNNLLPKIICGSSSGAVIAALTCCTDEDELPNLFEDVVEGLPQLSQEYKDLKFSSVVEGVIKSLYPPELILLERYAEQRLGNMTFEEAYVKSNRVLNIVLAPQSRGGANHYIGTEIPTLFNYLSTPNVTISSAIRCSIGSGILPGTTVLMTKNHVGEFVPYCDPNLIYFTPSSQNTYVSLKDSPYTHLSELFNVNSYLNSLSRPYFAPLFLSDFKQRGRQSWKMRLLKLMRLEFQYRVNILANLGFIPSKLQKIVVDEKIPGGFQVTIVPELSSIQRDFARVFDSHDIQEKARHWILLGERGVWPLIAIIWARCAIEFVLEDLFQRNRDKKLNV